MKRSVIALFLSLLLCSSFLFGCGGSPSASSPPSPMVTVSPAASPSSAQTPSQQLPSPTPFPTNARPADSDISENNGLLIIQNKGYETFYYKQQVCDDYSDAINSLAASLDQSVTVYSLITPTSIEFNAPPKYQREGNSAKNAIQHIYGNLSGIKAVDAYSALEQHQTDYIYFGTDHHWTARGAYYAYTAFCETAGLPAPSPLDSYESGRLDGFLGLYYSLSKSEALKSHPDYVEYFLPKAETQATVFHSKELDNPSSIKVVNPEIESGNKYMAFIGGDRPLIRIQTSAQTGRKILLIKESYGNAFAPWLTESYDEVWVLDPRETSFSLHEFLQEHDIHEVLVLNYAIGTTSQNYRDKLRALI
ncbi:MAG: DHHW family protein [Christensenellales bacterium]|jgi:hypothetical protein